MDVSWSRNDAGWWKKSKHRKLIQEGIDAAVSKRVLNELGLADAEHSTYGESRPNVQGPTLEDLLSEYNRVSQLERGSRSKETILKRHKAIRFLLRLMPDARPTTLTRTNVLAVRDEASKKYSPSSLRGYFVELKSLFRYAVREDYVQKNPFDGITIPLTPKQPRETTREDQYLLFAFLYRARRPLFYQALFERLTGIRVGDVSRLEWSNLSVDGTVLNYYNSKGKRWETYPLSEAARLLLRGINKCPTDKYIFSYRSAKTVSDYLVKGCKFTGITPFASHQLKRDYAAELADHEPDDRTYDALLHHLPSHNLIGVQHYSGKRKGLMLATLNAAQEHWTGFLSTLDQLPPLDKSYVFAKPKRKKAAKEM